MNTSLLIGTCDSYSFLWDNLVTLVDRNIEIDSKLVSCETKKFNYPGYTCTLSSDKNWSNRIINALEKVTTEYVFFILDDYYLDSWISKETISRITTLLDATGYNKYCLDCTGFPHYTLIPFSDNLFIQHQSSQYLTTLQPAIWRVSYLKSILKPNWSPWDFELEGTKLNSHYNNKIFMFITKPFYFNAARRGRVISEGWNDFKVKENLKDFIL